ncbi:MAG TPA: hypothetical protein VGO31_11670 [Microbacteriaceae bacterium]|nr:hypothetical protein [Microbacteriaceae bacterium]
MKRPDRARTPRARIKSETDGLRFKRVGECLLVTDLVRMTGSRALRGPDDAAQGSVRVSTRSLLHGRLVCS